MSDDSSSTSANGEWDRMSQCLSEDSLSCKDVDYSDVDSDGTTTGATSAKKCRELLKEEREKTKRLMEENERLRRILTGIQPDFTPTEWMSEEMMETENMIALMKSNTVLLYKTIIDMESEKGTSKSRFERKTLTEKVEAMEELCAANASAIKKTVQENIQTIEKMTGMKKAGETYIREDEETVVDSVKTNTPRDKKFEMLNGFLGTFECTERLNRNIKFPVTFSICKARTNEFFEIRSSYSDGSKTLQRLTPENDVRVFDRTSFVMNSSREKICFSFEDNNAVFDVLYHIGPSDSRTYIKSH